MRSKNHEGKVTQASESVSLSQRFLSLLLSRSRPHPEAHPRAQALKCFLLYFYTLRNCIASVV